MPWDGRRAPQRAPLGRGRKGISDCSGWTDSTIPATRRVLAIDDDLEYGRVVCRTLQGDGYEAYLAATAAEGLTRGNASLQDLILLEIRLPDIDGITIYKGSAGNGVFPLSL